MATMEDYLSGNYTPKTIWERVYLHLASQGFQVYSPNQKEGKCTNPYIVVKNTGTSGFLSSNQIGSQSLDILIYVPFTNYSNLETYTQQIQDSLSSLKEYIRPTGNITSVILDVEVMGYTQTLEYQTFQRLRR